MKSFYTILFVALISPMFYAQNIVYHDFVGYLTTSDGQKISFKLMIDKINSGDFDGFSITDYNGKDYTKSIISGSLDVKGNSLTFEEKGNLETASTAKESSFCYITATNLSIVTFGKSNIVKGKFVGLFQTGGVCARGDVLLVNTDELVDTIVIEKPIVSMPQSSASQKADEQVQDFIMTSNEELLVKEWSNNTDIEIWDANLEDGDAVSIFVDDVLIKENVVLKNRKAIIELPDNKESFRLKIVALNEGSVGINTLNFKFKDATNNE